jgi:hypothetical protein
LLTFLLKTKAHALNAQGEWAEEQGQGNEAERFKEEAMKALEESIQLKNQGYTQAGSLAMSVGEMGQALDEMSACRATASDLGREYLDWRWYPRYKQAIAFDVFGWLTHAGPFSATEEQEWKNLYDLHNEQAQERREQLMKASRDRELEKALAEEREPRLL